MPRRPAWPGSNGLSGLEKTLSLGDGVDGDAMEENGGKHQSLRFTCPRCGSVTPTLVQPCPTCGTSFDADIPSGPVFGTDEQLDIVRSALAPDYEVEEEVGRGGMGVVYRARERALDRDVAIKVLPFWAALDPAVGQRFEREARTVARLEHPHIIPIYRVGRVDPVIYFAMRFVRGESLGKILRRWKRLPLQETTRMLVQVGEALGYAARQGVVHRDIKPDNVLVDEAGSYLVTDFGIARSIAAGELTRTGTLVGTPRYMSPEQVRGVALDGRSDIYSLGVVAYQCLTGGWPFDGDEAMAILRAHLETPVPVPRLDTPEERELFSIIQRMLEKDPDRRIRSGDELATRVRGLATPPPGSEASEAIDATPPGAEGDRGAPATTTGERQPAGTTPGRGRDSIVKRLAAGLRALRRLPGVRWVTASKARVAAVLLLLAGLWGAQRALHMAMLLRSRCPVSVVGSSGDAELPFSVLIDPIGEQELGEDLNVYYDVCGLEPGAPYTVRLALSRSPGGLRAVLGVLGARDRPISLTFEERADGRGTRRQRRMELATLEPGTYQLELTVTDEEGRRREGREEFALVDD